MSKKKKIYLYEVFENARTGDRRVRNITNKIFNSGNYEIDKLVYSQKTPSKRREMEQMYNEGFAGIADKTGALDYAQTVEWGMEGGRPRIYRNEGEKCKAYRIRKKLREGKLLSSKEIEWLRARGMVV